MRTKTLLFASFLFPAALIVGVLVAPTMKEMALMQLSSSDSERSLETYAELHSKGDHSVSVLAPLIQLHLHYGDDEKAIALLEDFTQKNPKNIEGRRRLAELYKVAQRLRAYGDVLEEIEALAPSPEGLRELADTYAFLGDYKNEKKALARMAALDVDKLTEEDAVRLAKYYVAEDDLKNGLGALQRFWDKKDGALSFDTLFLLAQLHVENGNPAKAYAVAVRYVEKHPREEDVLTLSGLFQTSGQTVLARDILNPLRPSIESSPRLKGQLVSLLFAEGKFEAVERMLKDDFAKGRLLDPLAETLIDLALKRKEYGLAEAVLRGANFEDISTYALERYADFAFRENRKPLADVIDARLNAGRRGNNEPLLAALLALSGQRREQALAALLAVPDDALTQPEERLMAAHALYSFGKAKPARSLIYNLPAADVFKVLDPVEFAVLQLSDRNAAEAGEKKLADEEKDLPLEVREKADQARLFLKIGMGDLEGVRAWFEQHPRLSSVFYEDAFEMASRYHQGKIAHAIAQSHYRAHPSPSSRSQLVDALLSEKHYGEALALMQADSDKNPQALKEVYLGALSEWAQIIKASDKNFSVLRPFVDFALRRFQSENEQRELVYLLEEAGFKPEAEGLLVNLAANRPYESKEAQELLGFWGARLSPAALAWIKSRAAAAADAEQARWLSHLNASGHFEAVIDFAQGRPPASPEVRDVYLEALATARGSRLAETLSQEIEREADPARLKRLLSLAEQAGMQDLKDRGWRKMHALHPDDPEALRYVALQEAGANHYAAALPLIRRALRRSPDDYQLNLAYAGIMQHQKKKSEATEFYNRAFDQLSDVPEKSFYDRVTLAHLLYRKEGLAGSAALFRELIDENPGDKSLRADFAEILTENKQYDEAFAVLSP